MKNFLLLAMGLLISMVAREANADAATVAPTQVVPATASTPGPVKKSKKKKKAMVAAPAQPMASPAASPVGTASVTPVASKAAGKEAVKPVQSPTPSASPTVSAKAAGTDAESLKKQLVDKFNAGQAMIEEARQGLKQNEKTLKMDDESHNLMVYGKRHPSRDTHLVTLSLAILTPQLAGGDIGFTFLSHWNVGLGIGFMGVDPRVKYYFDGDNASFFLGMGYATYNFSLSGNIDLGGDSGSLNGTISGNFLHFTFGPSFQDKDGFFMEMPVDVGIVDIKGSGSSSGGSGSGSSNGSGSYNGPAGIIGFRWGY
ncbi:MAG TPA: hypothetical protein VMV05_08660, partial [bacterium]|nr:hypothetical protein [bacterium]